MSISQKTPKRNISPSSHWASLRPWCAATRTHRAISSVDLSDPAHCMPSIIPMVYWAILELCSVADLFSAVSAAILIVFAPPIGSSTPPSSSPLFVSVPGCYAIRIQASRQGGLPCKPLPTMKSRRVRYSNLLSRAQQRTGS